MVLPARQDTHAVRGRSLATHSPWQPKNTPACPSRWPPLYGRLTGLLLPPCLPGTGPPSASATPSERVHQQNVLLG